MQIPQKLGHNFTFHEMFDLSMLNTRFSKHRRLRVFHTHGTRCAMPECSKEGIYLIKAKNTDGGYHIDLYTIEFELMTIDCGFAASPSGGVQRAPAYLETACRGWLR